MPFAVVINRRVLVYLLAPALLALGGFRIAHGLPIYVEDPWLEKTDDTVENRSTRNRAEQIRRVTQYIQKTFKVAPHKTVAIITEAIYNGRKHNLQPELIL